MNGYNPMMDYQRNRLLAQQSAIQQQLASLDQMNPPMYQQQANFQNPSPQPPQTRYFTQEVASFDESKRAVPNPGEVYVFMDGNAGKIYLKQMNTDTGRSDYLVYTLDTSGRDAPKDPMAVIDERLRKIEDYLGGLRNESVPGSAENGTGGGESDVGLAVADDGEAPKAESAAVRDGAENGQRKKR